MEFTVAGRRFELERDDLVRTCARMLPDPIHKHYVVVAGRRFPPKQLLACATGLDRADFTTHQARRIMSRLGFVVARAASTQAEARSAARAPYGGAQADALEPYAGQWVALGSPTEVLVGADTPQEVLAWLAHHNRRASYGMFRVPTSLRDVEGMAPA